MPGVEQTEAQRAERAELARLDAQAKVDELQWLMSDKKGRRFVWRLLGQLGVYRQSYVGGDFAATAFNEGRRSVGLEVLASITDHCPGRFNEMQKEAKQHDRRSNTSK